LPALIAGNLLGFVLVAAGSIILLFCFPQQSQGHKDIPAKQPVNAEEVLLEDVSLSSMQPRQTLEEQAEVIRSSHSGLRIGVIGAASPTKEYTAEFGEELGRQLQSYAGNSGFVFTGGVSGVGVDVAKGFFQSSAGPGERFFVLLPEGVGADRDYRVVSGRDVEVVGFGTSMKQRRIGMGKVGDILIVVNGRGGTLDEAITCLKEGKKLIVFDCGGASTLLYYARKNNALYPALEQQGVTRELLGNIILANMSNLRETLDGALNTHAITSSGEFQTIIHDPFAGGLFNLDSESNFALNTQAISVINALCAAYNGLTLEIDVDALIDTSNGSTRLKGLGFREAVSALYRAQMNNEIPKGVRIRLINLNPNLNREKIIRIIGLSEDVLEHLVFIPSIPEDYLIRSLEPYLVPGSIRIIFADNLRYWGEKVDVLVKHGDETEVLSSIGLIVASFAKDPDYYAQLPQDIKDYIDAVKDDKGNIVLDNESKIKQLIFKPIKRTKVDVQYIDRLDRTNKALEGMV